MKKNEILSWANAPVGGLAAEERVQIVLGGVVTSKGHHDDGPNARRVREAAAQQRAERRVTLQLLVHLKADLRVLEEERLTARRARHNI